MNLHIIMRQLLAVVLLFSCFVCPALAEPLEIKHVNGPVEARVKKEEKIPNYYGIAFYKPTYALPYYYTGSPYNAVYQGNTPNNEQLKHAEVSYQFSFKVPAWKNIFNYPSTLFLAYTQLSYWQLYDHKPFIRESDYEPELFLANEVNWYLFERWSLNFANVGVVHQSNGFGNSLERSWNRLYIEAIASNDHWMVSVRPWYVISTNNNNQNITSYLGYVRFLAAYKWNQQVVSIQAHNLIEGGAKHATAELTWSFPLTTYLKGYLEVFSGYGQSLIEYNHRTNSAGVGIAVNDWI